MRCIVLRVTLAGLVAACLTAGVLAQTSWKPATLLGGAPPGIPVRAVGGGEVFVAATVTPSGLVSGLVPLRITPPFTQDVIDAVRDWRFQAAVQTMPKVPGDQRPTVIGPVESRVLIASVFRPPALFGPILGEPAKDVQPAPEDVVAPLSTVTPPYPPLARVDGVVVIEVSVGISGQVGSATIVHSVPGLDEAALAAARQWTFRPARIHGQLEETVAYLVFGFRQPVT